MKEWIDEGSVSSRDRAAMVHFDFSPEDVDVAMCFSICSFALSTFSCVRPVMMSVCVPAAASFLD